MKKFCLKIEKIYGLLFGLVIIIFFSAFDLNTSQQTPWRAPAEADNLTNPVKGDSDAALAGKKLFDNMCAICHGNKGKGDGMAGMSLKPRPTNLSLQAIQSQSDGAIYWKITEGRAPMATYKQALNDEQRWQLVNYIRQLKK